MAQLKGWLGDMGMEAESLSKKAVAEMIAETDGEVEELLRLRLMLAKTSVKKYEAIERSACSDGRVHGMLMFYGANRSGRWDAAAIKAVTEKQKTKVGRIIFEYKSGFYSSRSVRQEAVLCEAEDGCEPIWQGRPDL